MERKEFLAGSIICREGQPVQGLLLILEGTVKGECPGGDIRLKKGDVLGLSEVHSNVYYMTYTAEEKVTVAVYAYQAGELMTLLRSQLDTVRYFTTSVFRQFQEIFNQYKQKKADSIYLYRYFLRNYKRYEEMCEKYRVSPRTLPGQEEIQPLTIEEDIEPWLGVYYKGIYDLISTTAEPNRLGAEFYCGLMLKISQSIHTIVSINRTLMEYRNQLLELFMNEKELDLFDLFVGAYFRIYYLTEQDKPDPAFIDETINLLKGYGYAELEFFKQRVADYKNKFQTVDKEKPAQEQKEFLMQKKAAAVNDSLSVILEYSGCPKEVAEEFRSEISAYKQVINKNGSDEADRRQRMTLTRLFYQIYTAAFQISLQDEHVPPIVRMFFQFGYVDEELAGVENASYLIDIVDHLPSDPENRVYTIYEWMKAIYDGKKEPSRNEFDNDYNDYVHELKRGNKITAAEEAAMLSDRAQKVMFELENVFPVLNKITYGRITTFCPIFSEHNILKSLEKMLVSADMVNQVFNQIRERDFGAFYRETVYSQPDKGIAKEYISTEILPDVILMPNIGNRGIMWQEIEGKRRTTPARFMCSLFQMEELAVILTRLTGEFRWEMCKRIQGVRWNDVTERSLTSEYSDYIQSYKRNIDLSSDMKEKIKSDLSKNKNNTKEMFVFDYLIWIMYESNGSPRMNKVARNIFFTYCPFARPIREKVRTNPLYTEIMERYEIRLKQKLRHYDNLYAKLRSSGLPIPEEIEKTRSFLES